MRNVLYVKPSDEGIIVITLYMTKILLPHPFSFYKKIDFIHL